MNDVRNQFSAVCLTIALASVLLRLGYEDILDSSLLRALGDSVIVHIPLLLGCLVAINLDEDKSYRCVMQVIFFYLAIQYVLNYFGYSVSMLAGFIAGLSCYTDRLIKKKYFKYDKEHWSYIFYFVLGSICGILLGIFQFALESNINAFAQWLASLPQHVSSFLYGISEVLLKPLGLNTELREVILYQYSSSGNILGDYYLYLQGDSGAGLYMTGEYPIIIFGSLGIMTAVLFNLGEKKNPATVISVILLFISAILTGVTEGIELFILALAPVLYILHSLLSGVSFLLCSLLDCREGYRFSAGLWDYIVQYGSAVNGDIIILLGILFFLLYLTLFVTILNPVLIKDGVNSMRKKVALLSMNFKTIKNNLQRDNVLEEEPKDSEEHIIHKITVDEDEGL
ncbi:PTS transporter subunit EIIC [Vallitalea okinawensis]|uniref:PTS transporter subunit EIIC n=1 Tax=Vallitalea okinawensis TaxID=2078660 RepID=UPI0013003B4F|nr:PTS transporter subunit EIIC [Vallitalea okinawensis]